MALYRPLDKAKREIRLLRILPSRSPPYSTPAGIECELEYVSLDEAPKYHALSYTWQLQDSDVPVEERETVELTGDGRVNILLDDHVVPVTFVSLSLIFGSLGITLYDTTRMSNYSMNLWAALKYFRNLQYSRARSAPIPNEKEIDHNQEIIPEAGIETTQKTALQEITPGSAQHIRSNAICDGCETYIEIIRHRCIECADFDYCQSCFAGARFVHPGHRFIHIKLLEKEKQPRRDEFKNALFHKGEGWTVGTRLWVDAVCINQDDILERNSQVQQMKVIYQQAQGVDAWLGPEARNSERAMMIMVVCGLQMHQVMQDIAPEDGSWRIDKGQKGILSMLEHEDNEDNWAAVGALFRRSYWRRIWIVQELLSNTEVNLHCGQSEYTLSLAPAIHLTAVIQKIEHDPETIRIMISQYRTATGPGSLQKALVSLGGAFQATSSLFMEMMTRVRPDYRDDNLDELVSRYCDRDATDPRDIIYGLLGLSRVSVTTPTLDVNYALSISNVYLSAARYMIQSSQGLNILIRSPSGDCDCPPESHVASSELPSWVPNWACKSATRTAYSFDHTRFRPLPRQYSKSARLNPPTFSSDGMVLSCDGFELGHIKKIASVEGNDDTGGITIVLKQLLQLLSFLHEEADCQTPNQPQLPLGKCRCIGKLYFCIWLITPPDLISLEDFTALCNKILSLGICSWAESDIDEMRKWAPVCLPIGRALVCASIYFAELVVKGSNPENATSIGICSPKAMVGDSIVVLEGCRLPVLLRNKGPGKRELGYQKEVCLFGYMHGEAVGRVEEKTFEIS